MDCTNRNCPAYAKCFAPYRGSRCKATRATYGLGDPITNADRIRAMTDEDLAEWIGKVTAGGYGMCAPSHYDCTGKDSCAPCWLDWVRQEAADE